MIWKPCPGCRVTRVLPGVSFCGEGRSSQETKGRGQLSINHILGGGAGVEVIHRSQKVVNPDKDPRRQCCLRARKVEIILTIVGWSHRPSSPKIRHRRDPTKLFIVLAFSPGTVCFPSSGQTGKRGWPSGEMMAESSGLGPRVGHRMAQRPGDGSRLDC
jgi:hypothetical protein